MDLAREFIAEFQQRLNDFELLRKHTDWDGLATQAHWLKGAGGTAGFNGLTGPASRLEQAAHMADSEQVDFELATIFELSATLSPKFLKTPAGFA
jgi:HPt (histidine-containing phosphotransfer) domain-containing protein